MLWFLLTFGEINVESWVHQCFSNNNWRLNQKLSNKLNKKWVLKDSRLSHMLRSLMLSVILKNANTFLVLWSVYTHKYCKINKSQNGFALKVGRRYHCYLLSMKKVEQIGIGDVRKTICVKTKVDVWPFWHWFLK